MAVDIVPELLSEIEDDFNARYVSDQTIKSISDLVVEGKATYVDANEYAIRTGEILANVFKQHISSDILPNGRMYYNIADRMLNPTLGNNHELISDVVAQIQTELNHAEGIGIKGLKAPLNTDRIKGLIDRISSEEDYDKVSWLLDEPVINFSQNVVDDTIKTNAEFHAQSGLRPTIIRTAESGACKWCKEVAGKYQYPDVPEDVWRRHERCRCTLEYDPGDNTRRNVWTKQARTIAAEEAIEERKQFAAKDETNIVKKWALQSGVDINVPKKLKAQRSEDEIIAHIGGGDRTIGSCSSVAFAYAGNRAGFDVADFRGGESANMFATQGIIESIAKYDGVVSYIEKSSNDFTAINKLLPNVKEGKEYYLSIASHAAIIRKYGAGYQYLELQSSIDNGFKPLTTQSLRNRFSAKKSRTLYGQKLEWPAVLIDVESLAKSKDFQDILAFINTDLDKQKKGVGGRVR